jgi:F420-dependent oxidoreductase-like protein
MKVRVLVEPAQGATYNDLLNAALAAEQAGLDAFFRSDHYMHIGGQAPGSIEPYPGPTDAWTSLAGIARETERIRLGTLVSPVTFRHPGQLAIVVAQVDAMSKGRVELGIGAGWFEAEHLAYGIPFPRELRERVDRVVEQLEIITGLWNTPAGEFFSYEGKYYKLAGSPGLPKPRQRPSPPIIVGGSGLRRMPENAARFADECNASFLADPKPVFAALDRACEAIGRDPTTICRSLSLTVCCAEDRVTLSRRVRAAGQAVHGRPNSVGSPEKVGSDLSAYAAMGVERAYLQIMDLNDLEHIQILGERVAPLVADL